MFSTTNAAELPLSKIAEFIALEEAPADPDRRRQIRARALIVLEGAWWAGELIGQEPERRLNILCGLFSRFRSEISFVLPGQDPPPCDIALPDRSLYVDPRLIVPIPSGDSSEWTDASCEEAFKGLSAGWQLLIGRTVGEERAYSAFEPAVRSVPVSRIEFFRFLAARKYPLPSFWTDAENTQFPVKATPRGVVSRKVLETWYRNRIQAYQQKGTIPSRVDDWTAAKDTFGDRVRRETLRDLRRQLAPSDWSAQGRRSVAKR